MTRVGRHDKKLKTTFPKYINYDTHITHTHTTLHTITHTHIPHYVHKKVKIFCCPNFMPS